VRTPRIGVRNALPVARVHTPLKASELVTQRVIMQQTHAPWRGQQRQKLQIILRSAALRRSELDAVLGPKIGVETTGEGVAPHLADAVTLEQLRILVIRPH